MRPRQRPTLTATTQNGYKISPLRCGEGAAAIRIEQKQTRTQTHSPALTLRYAHSRAPHRRSAAILGSPPPAVLRARPVLGGIEVSTDTFARQVTLESNGDAAGTIFEDNYFDLSPGQTRTIRCLEPAGRDRVTVHAVNAATVSVNPR